MDPEWTSSLNINTQVGEASVSKEATRWAFIKFVKTADLSVRATNVLLRNWTSLEELNSLSEKAILISPNCGRKTAREILNFLDTGRKEGIIRPLSSVKEQLAEPPEESSISLLPLFSSIKLKNISVEDLSPGFHATVKLAELDLSVRTANVLSVAGLETIGEVLLTAGSDLLGQKNFGKKSLNELKDIVCFLCLQTNDVSRSLTGKTVHIDYTAYEIMISSFIRQCENNMRNQDLLIKRFSFQEGKVPTLNEIGQHFGITRERVRQVLQKGLKKLQKKRNLNKLAFFWEGLDSVVAKGGGVINLGALPVVLQDQFNWLHPPNFYALAQLLLLRQPQENFKEEGDLFTVESECLTCDQPLQQLLSLDFKKTESFHIQVIAARLCAHCKSSCPWKQPVVIFYRAFIERLVAQSEGRLVLHGDVVSSHGKWVGKYCENLKDVACHVLENYGKPMHFTEIASQIREQNNNFKELSDHNLHSSIIRYDKIVIASRGTYGLKSWELKSYRSVSTAIETFIVSSN